MLCIIYMKFLHILLLLSASFGFATSAFAISFDEFDAFNQTVQQESHFQKILAEPAPEASIETELEALLLAQYRVRAAAMDFQSDVHRYLPRALSDKTFSINPSDLESYKKLRLLQRVTENISDQIIYEYKRLKQTKFDNDIELETRERAARALAEINQTLAQLPEEDQLVLTNFITELQTTGAFVLPTMQVSLELESSRTHRKRVHAKIAKKAVDFVTRANRILDKKLPRALKEQEENVGPSTFVRPSVDKEGNVDGYHFPEGVVALTFDDGPHPQLTPELVEALKSHHDKINADGARASFFWLAENVVANPKVVQLVAGPNFSTNCHSWTHANLARANNHVLQKEVIDAIAAERAAYGHDFHFFRCPYGSCLATKKVRRMLADEKLVHAFWSIDSLDWLLLEPNATFRNVTEQLQVAKRGIVLMHDIHKQSIAAAKMILDWIKEQNDSGRMQIHLYTIDQAVDLQNQAAERQVSSSLEGKHLIK